MKEQLALAMINTMHLWNEQGEKSDKTSKGLISRTINLNIHSILESCPHLHYHALLTSVFVIQVLNHQYLTIRGELKQQARDSGGKKKYICSFPCQCVQLFTLDFKNYKRYYFNLVQLVSSLDRSVSQVMWLPFCNAIGHECFWITTDYTRWMDVTGHYYGSPQKWSKKTKTKNNWLPITTKHLLKCRQQWTV